MHLAVVEALLAALDLGLLPLDLVLGGGDLLLDPGGRRPPVLHLVLDLGAELAPPARAPRSAPRAGSSPPRARPTCTREPLRSIAAPSPTAAPIDETNQRHDRSEHAVLPPEGEGRFRDERRGCSHPAPACTAALRSWRVRSRSSRRVLPGVRWIEGRSDQESQGFKRFRKNALVQEKRRMEALPILSLLSPPAQRAPRAHQRRSRARPGSAPS